ncbi:MAG: Rieske (2Fe-2S) protein [Bacteroidota bacterium]|nr:Rieske (2Fe-2S) protein [Bacteroidota bacterium]
MKRRGILKGLVAGAAAVVTAPILYVAARFLGYVSKGDSSQTSTTVAFSDLTPEKPSMLVEINDEPIIVVREKNDAIRAFTATCTHLGCTVSYRPQVPDFYCKCHQGRYDENGVNVPGTRPKSPLTELTINDKGTELEITMTPKVRS